MRNPKLKRFIKFKDGVDPEDFFHLDPALMCILATAAAFYHRWGKTLVVTSLTDGVHKSLTHAECRGADIRIWNIPRNLLEELIDALNDRYAEFFGTGPQGATPKVAILEKTHIHLQVRRIQYQDDQAPRA